jgi:hypothetical protein
LIRQYLVLHHSHFNLEKRDKVAMIISEAKCSMAF